jgi:MinD-like ATPase involved in chromosome partitioning or flagellar assembly
MIELGLIDLSADGRRRLAQLVERWTWSQPEARHFSLPRVSLHLLAPQEVRFHGALDVCLIGPELIGADAAYINVIRQQLPGKIVLCVLDSTTFSFGMIEQLGRLGVDDVLMDTASSEEFFRRLVLLRRRVASTEKGRLIAVDAARGGVGATTISAALAEGWLDAGKTVCVVDGDIFSQDLTRFLQVRPCVNEPLRLLLDCQRVVTAETVAECAFPVWADEPRLKCVAPPVATDEAILSSSQACRTFIGVLEILQSQYQVVVVDAAPLIAGCRQALYQSADEVVLVANRDPAGAFATRQAVSLIGGYLRPESRLTTVVNQNSKVQAPLSVVRQQVLALDTRPQRSFVMPFVAQAARWACSGRTAFAALQRSVRPIIAHEDTDGGEGRFRAFGVALAAVANRIVPKVPTGRNVASSEAREGRRMEGGASLVLLPTITTEPATDSETARDAPVSRAVVAG